MIKLTKRIEKTIEREFSYDYTKIKSVFIKSQSKDLCVTLIVLKIGPSYRLVLMRYFGDGSYDFLSGFNNFDEIKEEISHQIQKLL